MIGGTVVGRERRERTRARVAAALSGALAAASLALAGTTSSAGAGPPYQLVDLGDFSAPVHVDNAPGAPNLLFVVEQAGAVRVLVNGVEQAEPFLDISGRVQSGGEQGLLSIAFHPSYEKNRRFYVFYNNEDDDPDQDRGSDLQIDQFKRSATDPTDAVEGSRRRIIVVPHNQARNHNAGQLQWGDGGLYISTGDGGPQGDEENDAQSRRSLLGKILRIVPKPKGGYTVPADNPFVGRKGRDEIWARGLRNPFRFSFDAEGGALTIGDVGGGAFEEIDYEPDGGRNANFGWNDFEGFEETSFGTGRDPSHHEPPIHAYPNAAGPDAVTGGYVIRDPDLPDLAGRYIYADFYDGALRTLVPSEDGATGDAALGLNAGLVSSFGEGTGRQIYVADYGGNVYALEPAT